MKKNTYKDADYEMTIIEAEVYNAAKDRTEIWTKVVWLSTPSYINPDHLRSLFADRRCAIRYFRKQVNS